MRAVASLEKGPNENLKGSFRFESTIPRVSFSVVQISPIPIISNPLTAQLLSLANTSILAAPKMGFLTMNQTRKLLFLTEDSGSLSRTPIVGVWTALDVAPHSTSSTHLHHPFVWAACTRFLFFCGRSYVPSGDRGAPLSYLVLLTLLQVLVAGSCATFYEVTAWTDRSCSIKLANHSLSEKEAFARSDFTVDLFSEGSG